MKNNLLLLFIIITLISCNNENTKDVANADYLLNNYSGIPNNTIINLYDAFGKNKKGMEKDFGFSCIIKYDDKTILFDAGTNAEIFKKNVEALKIDLRQIDFAVASHAHFDHINGFDYLLEINPDVKIFFPFDFYWGANIPFDLTGLDLAIADSLDKEMLYFDGDYDSYRFNQSGRFWKANIEYIKNNREVAPGVKLISTSSPYLGYYSKYPNLKISQEGGSIDKNDSDNTRFIELPELSLALTIPEGEILIVGCSHSTVETIITETKSYINNDIALVYGGFHLLPYDRTVLTDLSTRLKNDLKVKRVAPAHCTGHLAFKILQNSFKEDYVFAGLGEVVNY
jgi:7,8-dihydropterin-6-yl-methyl-4-(beta-D-ribofuranosyl)aminobenzene 5'-phosphate synthase